MTNSEFELAEQFVLHTRKHCFVTGKAGTGKTTLLKELAAATQKSVVVVAPTGVAAVNAGGATIHSMFGLPLTCFVPSDDVVDPNIATNRYRLLGEYLRLTREKLHVLREMDLLIIDEVSMVRADIFDAIDGVLRHVRGNRQPLGDVQVLLIGDVHQLPPVVRDAEWEILKAYYRSPYFFDSRVWAQLNAAQIELRKVYRQSDERFLELLNNIRNRQLDKDDLRRLQERYVPDFKPPDPGYVLLTTHNRKADNVNSSELANLPDPGHAFEARIEGEFPEALFPCDSVLQLKIGAQVMFIRNDTEAGAYYNGKLAIVERIDDTGITVTFRDSGRDYTLHPEIWENFGYRVEEQSGKVVREELGTFRQYPLRLAWAITIHKSQGLTFDKVIIDAGRSFAAGQVYVALSRCRSLEGIVLHSLITPSVLYEEPRIDEFSGSHQTPEQLQGELPREKIHYAQYLMLRLFAFSELSDHLEPWQHLITETALPEEKTAITVFERVRAQLEDINTTAHKFRRQLRRLIEGTASDPNGVALLKERCARAIEYFTGQIATQLVAPLREHIDTLGHKKKMKRYAHHLQRIEESCWRKIERLYCARFLNERLYVGEVSHMRNKSTLAAATEHQEKGATHQDTLELHRRGKTADEIAAMRGLTVGTIKSHLVRLIASGTINVHEVLPADTIDPVLYFLRENANAKLTAIRKGTGDKFDYNDIRMVVAHQAHCRSRE
ncbi:MAG TPA: helix-turn-helix domain-containing protein [Steroidobacteraceae bacterium]|nr:helix-turn-helix domain-containing protein [Steroidobacteraceae bacterium]